MKFVIVFLVINYPILFILVTVFNFNLFNSLKLKETKHFNKLGIKSTLFANAYNTEGLKKFYALIFLNKSSDKIVNKDVIQFLKIAKILNYGFVIFFTFFIYFLLWVFGTQ